METVAIFFIYPYRVINMAQRATRRRDWKLLTYSLDGYRYRRRGISHVAPGNPSPWPQMDLQERLGLKDMASKSFPRRFVDRRKT